MDKINAKKITALIMALAMALALASCGNSNTSSTSTTDNTVTASDTSTVVSSNKMAKITAISGNNITVQFSSMSQPEMPSDQQNSDGNQPLEMPSDQQNSDGNQPPEMPSNQQNSDSNQPPEMPSNQQNSDSNQPPEMPSNQQNSGSNQSPEMPSNQQNSDSSQPPEMPSGQPDNNQGGEMTFDGDTITFDLTTVTTDLSIDSLNVGDILSVEVDGDNNVISVSQFDAMPQQGGNSGGNSAEIDQGSTANEITENSEVSDTEYSSTGDDENALRVTGATVTLDNITVDKSAGSSSNVENGDFYGVNAALLATDGADVTITNANVTSDAQNGNGVFSYGENTVVNISDSTIRTNADNSGGIQTTGGATTNANNLTVETSGNSSAAIRSDRGGGTVNVDSGTYTSNGYNSPAVYSTADITVSNAKLTANNSEALVIEGDNSISLEDCDVYGNMSDTDGSSSDINVHNIMLYQSMSGDAETGTSTFSMTGGTLTSNNGDMFYITNTNSVIKLSDVAISNNDSNGNFMTVTGNNASKGWGTAGSNGANVEFTADNLTFDGTIEVDTISTLNMSLENDSTFTGTINIVDNAENGTAIENNFVITIDEGSTWVLTDDCTITSLENNGTIDFNGHTITLADGTVLSE